MIIKYTLHHFSLDWMSPISSKTKEHSIDNRFKRDNHHIFPRLFDYLRDNNIHNNKIIKKRFKEDLININNFYIISDGLPFQDKNINSTIARSYFSEYQTNFLQGKIILSTDGSKNNNFTSIAAINVSHNINAAAIIDNNASIFTAEALAISLAIIEFANSYEDYVLFSDSKSNLSALSSFNLKSHSAIFYAIEAIVEALHKVKSITIIWVPSHLGIPVNEKADLLARNGPFLSRSTYDIASEDIITMNKKELKSKINSDWINSKYFNHKPYLGSIKDYINWTPNRKLGVLLTRLRTGTLPVNKTLHRFKCSVSPLCPLCNQIETIDHFLLQCPCLSSLRRSLFTRLNISDPNVPLAHVISRICANCSSIRAFCTFLACSNRF
ncbi:uncharacterized protein LOC129218141 [Uloborus diversus]|uniref:uncharacterized protein LOC129218141 n=1 Tax=Uloborus diversus TaxID=327109 RepID=UPI00240A94E6|nr:uncharacterized protein LOC129218141 [Uloborus diversus]XP_054708329.1 uncharacterized protein LOC129218141 [Uloborus diversus]